MSCFCCAGPLLRAADIPDARWLRRGDQYCRMCDFVIWREHLVDGWPDECAPCRKHRVPVAAKGDA
jgi:hypothetical protein